MSTRVALASLVAADLYLLWRLIQADLGETLPLGRDALVLGIAALTLLSITVAISLFQRQPRARAVLVVRNGSVRRGDQGLAASTRGRPAVVIVQEGHVAVLEKLGRYTRILGPGAGRLHAGETIHKVILTGPRPLVGVVDCSTSDSVPVTAEFELEARILAARDEAPSRRPASPAGVPASGGRLPTRGFEWSQEAVVKAAYASPSWELAVLNAAKNVLRQEVASSSLDQVFDLEERHREAFPFSVLADRLRLQLNDQCASLGAEILRFQVNRLKLPVQMEQSIVAKWKTRHQPAGTEAHAAAEGEDEAAAPPHEYGETRGATLRLVPVLGRGAAASLREAIRQRLGYLTADAVEINGQTFGIHPAAGSAASELSLRPDATYFALPVLGDNLQQSGLTRGDYMLFEAQSEARSGALVATLIGGDLGVKRITRKTDHSLLEPDRAGQPAIVLTDGGARRDAIFPEYAEYLPPVEYWPADDARILGRAVILFRPVTPRAQLAPAEQTAESGSGISQETPPLDGESADWDAEAAAVSMPAEAPPNPLDPVGLVTPLARVEEEV